MLITQLPQNPCDGSGPTDSSGQEIALLVITGLATIGCLLAAVRQWVPIARRNQIWILVGLVVVALVALAVLLVLHSRDNGATFVALYLGGAALTGLAMLALLVAWGMGRRVGDVGPLLPLYLLGAGVFCFPPTVLAALILNSGALC